MKNLIYILAIAVTGLVACGAPAEKSTEAEDTAAPVEATADTTEVMTDSTEVVAEEIEVDSTATEEAAE